MGSQLEVMVGKADGVAEIYFKVQSFQLCVSNDVTLEQLQGLQTFLESNFLLGLAGVA